MTSPDSAIVSEAQAFMDEIEPEPPHVKQVCQLAIQLYDELQDLHQLSPHARDLLQAGALLHDIGWSVSPSGKSHHKHSSRLIREKKWTNASLEDVSIISQVARYHRKALPKPEHEEFDALSAEHQDLVSTLAAILRIADALDRTHRALVDRVRLQPSDSGWRLSIESDFPCLSEKEIVDRKKDLFERFFKTALEVA